MKIDINFKDENLTSFNCIITDPLEIKLFDRQFSFGDDIIVDNETRHPYELSDEETRVILARAANYRRIYFEDDYNNLKSEQIETINNYLTQLHFIAPQSNHQKMLSSLRNFISEFKTQNGLATIMQSKIASHNPDVFTIEAANHFLMAKNELTISLQQFKTRLNSLTDRCLQFVEQLDEKNQQSVLAGFNNNLNKLNSQHQKLMDQLTTLQKQINQFIDHNNQVDNKLNFILSNLEPVKNKYFLTNLMLNEGTSSRRFILQTDSLIKIGLSQLKRAALIVLIPEKTSDKADEEKVFDAHDHTIIEVTEVNGSKKFLSLPAKILEVKQITQLFLDHGAIADLSNSLRARGALGPKFFDDLKGYNKEIIQDYQNIHAHINLEVQNILPTIPSNESIELAFIGCGKGEELEDIIGLLEKMQRNYKIYAFDVSDENIAAAKQQPFVQHRPVYLKSGDANNFEQLIQDFRNEYNDGRRAQHTITIASGFLTRFVNKDPCEALDIFKKIARHMNTIIISGRTPTLIKREDAKTAGFTIHHTNYVSNGHLRTLDRYEALPVAQQVERLLAKQQRGAPPQINLKDHPQPMMIIKYLLENKNDILAGATFDLRDAYIDQQDSQHFSMLQTLLSTPFECHLIITGQEPWLATLASRQANLDNCLSKKENERITLIDTNNIEPILQDKVKTVNERPKVSDKQHKRVQDAVAAIDIEETYFSFRR